MKPLLPQPFVSILLLCVNASWAEDIKIPISTQTSQAQQTSKPIAGMSKHQVKDQFGEPRKENPAKGKPLISSWEYAEFSVYFENDHVIHSVIKPTLRETKEIIIETTDEMPEDKLKTLKNNQ